MSKYSFRNLTLGVINEKDIGCGGGKLIYNFELYSDDAKKKIFEKVISINNWSHDHIIQAYCLTNHNLDHFYMSGNMSSSLDGVRELKQWYIYNETLSVKDKSGTKYMSIRYNEPNEFMYDTVRAIISKNEGWLDSHLIRMTRGKDCPDTFYYKGGKMSRNKDEVVDKVEKESTLRSASLVKEEMKEVVDKVKEEASSKITIKAYVISFDDDNKPVIEEASGNEVKDTKVEEVDYNFYNETLRRKHNRLYGAPRSVINLYLNKDMIIDFNTVISENKGWKRTHVIRASPTIDGYNSFYYHNGRVKEGNDYSTRIHYSFVRKTWNDIEVSKVVIPDYQDCENGVYDFHLLSESERTYVFHSVILLNKWHRDDNIIAIPSDDKPIIKWNKIVV